jgi:hypothetical protein
MVVTQLQSTATPGAMAPKSLPYADVCENNELRTYCIRSNPYQYRAVSGFGMAEMVYNF